MCEHNRCCGTCGGIATRKNHEFSRNYCQNCNENKEVCHSCNTRTLKNVLSVSNRVLHLFYDFETIQNTKYSDRATLHVPNLDFVQQFSFQLRERGRCRVRLRVMWQEEGLVLGRCCRGHAILCGQTTPLGSLDCHDSSKRQAFDRHFILNVAILLKWQPELIMIECRVFRARYVNSPRPSV